MRNQYLSKRILATMLSAAMLVSGIAPAAVAEEFEMAPEDVSADVLVDAESTEEADFLMEDDVVEEDAELLVPEEEYFEAEAAADSVEEITTDDVSFIMDDETEAVEAEAATESEDASFVTDGGDEIASEEAQDVGQNAVPAAVTDLVIVPKDDNYSQDRLYWKAVDQVYAYEFKVVDSLGREYRGTSALTDEKPIYYRTVTGNKTPVISLPFGYGYAVDAQGNIVFDADGSSIAAFEAGQVYGISIRAVNRHTTAAADGTESVAYAAGEWSVPVNYTVAPAKLPVDIKAISFVKQENGYAYFTFDETVEEGLRVEIFTAADYSEDSRVWADYDTFDYKLRIDLSDLAAGTYYLRVWDEVDGKVINTAGAVEDYKYDTTQIKYAVTSFAVTAEQPKTPPTLTNLAYLADTGSALVFTVDAFDTDFSAKVEISKTADFTGVVNSIYIYYSDLWGKFVATVDKGYFEDADTVYYVRALVDGGTPSATITVSRPKTPINLTNLYVKERRSDGYVIGFDGVLTEESMVEYWVSSDPNFANTRDADGVITRVATINGSGNEFLINDYDFHPGKSYYVKARTKTSAYWSINGVENVNAWDNSDGAEAYGAFSNVLTLSEVLGKPGLYTAGVTKTSVTLEMQGKAGATGYELQRKTGKKWVTLAKTTDNTYQDSGLSADTVYKYRARLYDYDERTKSDSYGEWTYVEAMTWGGSLNLKAVATGTTKVKLSWKKIKGAKGYEIYKRVTYSATDVTNDGMGNGYEKFELVKTVKKKSFTVKKLSAGSAYEFWVRAFKTVGKKKVYIDDFAYVDLGFNSFSVSSVLQQNGSLKLKWTPMGGAAGYVVEKYAVETGQWIDFQTLGKKADSVILPADPIVDVRYRIYAYRTIGGMVEKKYAGGNGGYYDEDDNYISTPYWTVRACLAAPTSVSAVADAAGNVIVSWAAVPGASYYEVYRTVGAGSFVLNKTLNGYSVDSEDALPVWVPDNTAKYGYSRSYKNLTETTFVDRKITYTVNGIEYDLNYSAPEPGVQYYYYVKAFGYRNGASEENNYSEIVSSACSKPAKAIVTAASVGKTKIKSAKSAKRKITVKWKKVAGAEGYEIYRSTKKNSGYMKVGNVIGNKASFKDTSAEKGKRYFYKVKALKINEAGAYQTSANSKASKKVRAK